MALRFFVVPVPDSSLFEQELNGFLAGHKVVSIERQLIDRGVDSFWAICVDYLSGTPNQDARPFNLSRSRVDYKAILPPAEFAFPVGRFHQFLIRDPKERVITAPCFEERVLHHAIMNVCEPLMDRWLIDDTFACRIGRGREAAIERAHHFTRQAAWFLKLDVRKYFDSVPHTRLTTLLECRFKDRRLLELLHRIIAAYRGDLGVGLPIGSLTSQHFANFYLGWLDRFVKESFRIRGYVRYMDDMLLWHTSRKALVEVHDRCREFAGAYLALDFKSAEVRRTGLGVPFLGCRIWPSHVALNRRSKRRWRRRVRVLERAER